MLDNMTPEMMKEAVKLIDGRAKTECSGNVTKENIAKIRDVGVDYVSSGALTHSAPILIFRLRIFIRFPEDHRILQNTECCDRKYPEYQKKKRELSEADA